jgi:L-ascorbate metabolism protein UlaG (beta-lactamase superfamily)
MIGIALIFLVASLVYFDRPMFGGLPRGKYLKRIKTSPNYYRGQFHNRQPFSAYVPSKMLKTAGALFRKERKADHIRSTKTDLLCLDSDEEILVWFGHSSFFLQISGQKILVDPVFSEIASPVPFFGKAFPGSNAYAIDELPPVDCLIITHDHWDHLDHETVKNLKTKKIICPLGVGSHFRRWKFPDGIIFEMDWEDSVKIEGELEIHCLPARHFSGRGLLKNKSLWASFLIQTSDPFRIFISGDGGYGQHFVEIGKKFEGIDLAILESGQYNESWREIHMTPVETLQAAEDLGTKALLPVHMAKFSLSTHSWDDPLNKVSALAKGKSFKLLTPMIGQRVEFKKNGQTFTRWWEG